MVKKGGAGRGDGREEGEKPGFKVWESEVEFVACNFSCRNGGLKPGYSVGDACRVGGDDGNVGALLEGEFRGCETDA